MKKSEYLVDILKMVASGDHTFIEEDFPIMAKNILENLENCEDG